MYNSQQNQEIIRLILRLRALEQDYPNGMLTARRVTYRMLISRHIQSILRRRRQMMIDLNKKIPS